jgi:uncharacterized protein (DUF2141 family)
MKKLASLSLLCLALSAANAATLDVKIEGISNIKGNLLIVGYDSAEAMESGNNAWQKAIHKVTTEQATVQFENVAPGQYGFMIFQDLDNDFKLATNLFGVPTEPFGFSNNPVVRGRPGFADIAFTVGSDNQTITISLE